MTQPATPPGPVVKRDADLDSVLDSEGEITIGSIFRKKPSDLLYDFAPSAYLEELRAYRLEFRKRVIVNEFPLPIAYPWRKFEDGWENYQERFNHLCDVWESLALFLMMMVIAECVDKQISLQPTQPQPNGPPVQGPKVNLSDLWSDKISSRLKVTRELLTWTAQRGIALDAAKIIPLATLDAIAALNQTRNEFKHSLTMPADECKRIIDETTDEVVDLLRQLHRLSEVRLYRFHQLSAGAASVRNVKHVGFRGHSTEKQFHDREYTQAEFARCSTHLENTRIIVEFGSVIGCASPFFYPLDESAERVRLFLFRYREGGGCKCQTFGSAQSKIFDGAQTKPHDNLIRAIFGVPPLP